MKWEKVSLRQFHSCNQIDQSSDYDAEDRILATTACLFNLSTAEMEDMNPLKVHKLIDQTVRLFLKPFPKKTCKRLGKYFLQYNIKKLSLRQYAELEYQITKDSGITNAHYILSAIACLPFCRTGPKDFESISEYIHNQPIDKVVGALVLILEEYYRHNNISDHKHKALLSGENILKRLTLINTI